MHSIRRSAKTVITDMSTYHIKAHEVTFDKYMLDHHAEMLFAFEMIALRMDWTDLQNKLKRWRSENLRTGLTQTKGKEC